MTAALKQNLHKKLLLWYRQKARDLPWRRTKDPYRIWVSEIMLQQTQVATVIPYYKKWLRKFPDIKTLAQAPQSEVLEAWAGLGYYRRARMLHAGAMQILETRAGKLPETAKELQHLPGIGRYTAAAIASIAFHEPTAVLDGNVIRILTRLFAIKDDISNPKTVAGLWQQAQELITDESPGDFNQAMMELGATVCLPQNPDCNACPVNRFCESRKRGCVDQLPFNAKKEKSENLKTFALVCRHKNSVLLRQQPENGRWGGLWMFPHWADKKAMLKESGLTLKALEKLMTVRHAFTRYRVNLEVYACGTTQRLSTVFQNGSSRWIPLDEIRSFGLPAPHQ